MNILILGGGLQGLSCGDSLNGKGHSIDVISDELEIRKSGFFRKVFLKDKITELDDFRNIIGDNRYDIVIPMGDAGVSFLSKHKSVIQKDFNINCACPEYHLFSIVENKQIFMTFCENNNIPHPKTIQLRSDNFEDCIDKIGFPSLIKPDFSVGSRGVTKVNNKDELEVNFPNIFKTYGSCTLQEYIDNNDYYYNVMLYRDQNGNYLGETIIKIVRKYPIQAGSSSYCVAVENNELLKVCKECLDKLAWVGMANIDVLQRLDNKEYKIIEINARVPASLRAAAISGVNFPEIIALDCIGEKVPNYNYCPGKSLRYMGIDLMWFLKSPNRFSTKPCWFKFWGKDLYYQDIYANDISTWWTWFVRGLAKIQQRNKQLR